MNKIFNTVCFGCENLFNLCFQFPGFSVIKIFVQVYFKRNNFPFLHTLYFFNLSEKVLPVCCLLPRDGCFKHHIAQDHKYPFPALKLQLQCTEIYHSTHIRCNLSASENDPELSTHSDWIQLWF